VHCLKKAFHNLPSESLSSLLFSLTLQPGLKRVHGPLAIQKTKQDTERKGEDDREASGGASVALRLGRKRGRGCGNSMEDTRQTDVAGMWNGGLERAR
jgi:hypothetical protein